MIHPHTCSRMDRSDMTTTITVQDGWHETVIDGKRVRLPVIKQRTTQWLQNVKCGYLARATDPDCGHCALKDWQPTAP